MIGYFAVAVARVRDADWVVAPSPAPVQLATVSAPNAGIKQLIKLVNAALTWLVPNVVQRWCAGKISNFGSIISWRRNNPGWVICC